MLCSNMENSIFVLQVLARKEGKKIFVLEQQAT